MEIFQNTRLFYENFKNYFLRNLQAFASGNPAGICSGIPPYINSEYPLDIYFLNTISFRTIRISLLIIIHNVLQQALLEVILKFSEARILGILHKNPYENHTQDPFDHLEVLS